jgi:DNA repair photolyase
VAVSGNTDCYQPVEKQLRLTRRCLEVFLKFRNPAGLITKNALILRDLDILREMSHLRILSVIISLTTLDNKLCKLMEPRASAPAKRLEVLERLVEAGIPACVNVAPVIPGLNDHEIPAILQAAAQRGVKHANYILMRLPHSVKDLFTDWLKRNYPDRCKRVLNSVKATRAGELNDPCFSQRKQGTGIRAETIADIFRLNCKHLALNETSVETTTALFRRSPPGQGELFV